MEPATPVEFATGWQRPDLTGPGWQVANIDHGAGGWLAVSRGATTVAHTSTGGGLWSATTLQGLHGENPLAAVGESAIAVAVSGDGRSDASVARWSDLGRSWIVEQVEDGAWFAGMGTVGDEPYLVGSTGEEPDFHLHDVGVAAIWKHDAEDWSRIPLEAGPGSVVTSLVTGPDGLVAFGHTSTGPAAWGLDDGVATPVNLVLPDRSPGNTLTSVVFDGGTVVTGIGSESGATILFRGIDGHSVPKKLR